MPLVFHSSGNPACARPTPVLALGQLHSSTHVSEPPYPLRVSSHTWAKINPAPRRASSGPPATAESGLQVSPSLRRSTPRWGLVRARHPRPLRPESQPAQSARERGSAMPAAARHLRAANLPLRRSRSSSSSACRPPVTRSRSGQEPAAARD